MFLHSAHHITAHEIHNKTKCREDIRCHPFAKTFGDSHVRNSDKDEKPSEKPKVKHDFIVRLHIND